MSRHIRDAKSHVDSKTPADYSHLHRLGKPHHNHKMRIRHIEFENAILLNKMTSIVSIDSKLKKIQDEKIGPRSLNISRRKADAERINNENLAILKKLRKA